ncbi:dihydroxyacetone kinase [Leucobacter exalbidus]|uniref:Dihydroxyacetone kinase n=1 Tax=Leucobacter exalbidus TaxID=662960 RepID=A0A940T6C1_9MICO|nr:dihydroxyacetone kinase subunit DhaK [Leucobacter exalbidus]MBP1326851.1 dihydroxyacetone kinase [Leucobacter exalbidus]
MSESSPTEQAVPTTRLFLPTDNSLELEALRGFVASHGDTLSLTEEPLFVSVRETNPARVVGLVSGGGSGHEPLHAGFVGQGGLDAAVPGRVFASPHNTQVLEASKKVAGSDGVLLIVKNYTGDIIHFGIAAERLAMEGVPVAQIVVDDDVATDDPTTGTGRRGTGATAVVEKLLGARADQGASLAELEQLGNEIIADSRSLAVATGPLTSFATGEEAFEITPGTVEYGIGIHGEPAPETVPATSLEALVKRMTDDILASLPGGTDRVIAVVNGLGGATPLELGAIMHTLEANLTARAITIDSALVGTFVSALDMRGFMITLTKSDDQRRELWLAKAALPGVPATSAYVPVVQPKSETAAVSIPANAIVDAVAARAAAAHAALTRLDQLAGDGDFGDNLVSGVTGAANEADDNGIERLARSFLDNVGGSSGPLIGLLLSAVSAAFADQGENINSVDAAVRFRTGIAEGLAAIQRVGGAQPGDRTMVDALHGAVTCTEDNTVALCRALIAGAQQTSELRAKRGRASYVGERALGAPDAGAIGVSMVLTTIAGSIDPANAAECAALFTALLDELTAAAQAA